MLAETPRPPADLPDGQAPWWPSRFGPDDQIGSLDEITPAAIVAAARLVRERRVFDLDGLNHLQIGDRFYNGWRTKDIVENWGTSKLGIETVPPIITRGVLVDMPRHRGVARLQLAANSEDVPVSDDWEPRTVHA